MTCGNCYVLIVLIRGQRKGTRQMVPIDETLANLATRLNGLEQENARLRDKIARMEERAPVTVQMHETTREDLGNRTNRRGMLRTMVGVTAATVGAGAMLRTQSGTAMASGSESQTTFTSNTSTPTIEAKNYGSGAGVYGRGDTGIAGYSSSATGTGSGVYGYSNSTAGYGVYGAGNGVSGIGVSGHGATGVSGMSMATGGYGMTGLSNNGTGVGGGGVTGVEGIGEVAGVSGSSDSGAGVKGHTKYGTAVSGDSDLGTGVYGSSTQGLGVSGRGGIAGVQGQGTIGVQGTGADRGGVFEGGTTGAAVQLVASSAATHPSSGNTGDLFVDASSKLWYCYGGTNWKQLA